MTFALLPAWQAWLLISAAAAIACALFWIKARPPRLNVPSLLLWARVFATRRELTWWERVRRAVSCAITMLLAAALAMALARPSLGGATAAERTLIVLDTSWSMAAARPSGGTRWERAAAEAAALARALPGEVVLATTAHGVVLGPTTDDVAVERALAGLAPSAGDQEPWAAMASAGAVHFFTDGAVARALDERVLVHLVHEPAPNVALTALEARPATTAGTAAVAYLEIGDFADAPQNVHLTLTRGATVIADRAIAMDAGEIRRELLPLASEGGPRLRARVSADGNALAIDDEAVAWVAPADPVDVLLVSDRPGALAGVMDRDEAVRVRSVAPAAYRDAGDADLVVFDRWLPGTPPQTPMLAIAPPSSAWLGTARGVEALTTWTVQRPHETVAGVDTAMMGLTEVVAYDARDLDVVAATPAGTPVVSISDTADRRLAVFAFDLGETLARAPAFPVIVSNTVDWLARPYRGAARQPGLVTLAAGTSRIVGPDGQPVPLVRTADRVQATLPMPGLYLVRAGGSQSVIPVNAGHLSISNLLRTPAGSTAETVAGEGATAPPLWLYAVAVALAMAVLEWWTWQRRVTV